MLLVLISTFSFAQNAQPVSLETAIEMAKKNNTALKIADKEMEKQTVLKKQHFKLTLYKFNIKVVNLIQKNMITTFPFNNIFH